MDKSGFFKAFENIFFRKNIVKNNFKRKEKFKLYNISNSYFNKLLDFNAIYFLKNTKIIYI